MFSLFTLQNRFERFHVSHVKLIKNYYLLQKKVKLLQKFPEEKKAGFFFFKHCVIILGFIISKNDQIKTNPSHNTKETTDKTSAIRNKF